MKTAHLPRLLSQKSRRSLSARPIPLCETLESRLLLSNAPFTLASDTFVFFQTSGTAGTLPPSALHLTFASFGSDYTSSDLFNSSSNASGTYTYFPTGSNSGSLVTTSGSGVSTITINFTTSATGTAHLIETAGTEDGVFALLSPSVPSRTPATIAGSILTFSILAGGNGLTSSGSYEILPAATGNVYTLQSLSGTTPNSSGTLSYTPMDNANAGISFHNGLTSNGAIALVFTSPTTGYYDITNDAGSGSSAPYQVGAFTFTAAPITLLIATFTSVTSSFNPVVEGSSLTFTATVTPAASNNDPATGTVTFLDGITPLGNAALSLSGHASFTTTTNLALGKHPITAVYSGDADLTASTSPVLTQAVTHSHADNVTFVTQLYTDVLKHTVDSSGLSYWTNLLDTGADTLADMATALTSSREYDGDVVDAFYLQYFHRHSDAAGLTYWVNKMQAGLNAETIRAGLLGSAEYFTDSGGTGTSFITALYTAFLNRTPNSADLSYWLNKFATQSRTQVSSSISNSDENRTDIVTGFYESYLHRAADPTGLAYWKSKLASGVTQPQIVTAFVTLPEYLTLHGIA